ncbi:hypothetical protein [Singulisphaera acidiphila]|uniref:Uncharacterized protein n=1 Tax=Singulisphaera acidiphila (strain ATCC BAA-1392 / DSM 18658 / VKM B-2454 / MOB10) TaxID=886293 RepID=L0DHU3_SINAD|nr:hypothetical protein [Singulisphaera acidiphila]AGA28944.1 hypothetical protein Sinac_4779 [Singulisphaera acidiphila DSM 18658]
MVLRVAQPEPLETFIGSGIPMGKQLRIAYFPTTGPQSWRKEAGQRMLTAPNGAKFTFKFVDAGAIVEQA